ncbi:hypothetical protein L208DRAFT_1265799 [Tricholoma matsutake]|nr:hypothetical protein L208DRAFT_1265799 [Tricholoma matsutake 945]
MATPSGAPPVHLQYTPPMTQEKSAPHGAPAPVANASQLGEEYRAELYARCAKGIHQPQRKYGACGIITAILCFPIGLICLFTDSSKVCSQCGVRLEV